MSSLYLNHALYMPVDNTGSSFSDDHMYSDYVSGGEQLFQGPTVTNSTRRLQKLSKNAS